MNETFSTWTQVRVTVRTAQLDQLVAVMSAVDTGLMIEDYSDFDLNGMYGELADESILNADRTVASVSVFLPGGEDPGEKLRFIRSRMAEDGIEGEVSVRGVSEADWINNWKKYYKPLHLGRHTVIVPKWEDYTPAQGETVVRMDPGMAFGTGSHETTRTVIAMLERYVRPGDAVLDVGTGSGILGICAMKFGAGSCFAYDIDPVAVETAAENFEYNGVRAETGVSDLLRGVKKRKYDIICANIVADIILRLLPDIGSYMAKGCILFLSGIITERAEEIEKAARAAGLEILERIDDNDWTAFAVTEKENEK